MSPNEHRNGYASRWRRFGWLAAATVASLVLLAVTVGVTDFGRILAAGNAPAAAVAGWVAQYWWVFGMAAFWGLAALAIIHAAVQEGRLLRWARAAWVALGIGGPCAAAVAVWWASLAAG